MSRVTIRLLLFLLAVAPWGCTPSAPAFNVPPAASYSVEAHHVILGGDTSLQAASVTKEFFPTTGLAPSFGRFFVEGDFAPAAGSTLVLGNELWTNRFNASPTVLGQTLEIDGRRAIIVGVAPKGFAYPPGAQFWMPKKP